MPLDQPTLLVTAALLIGCTGLLILVVGKSGAAVDAMQAWGLSMIAGSGGLVLAAASNRLGWLPDGFSTTTLIGAAALSWTAARLFAERAPNVRWVLAGPTLSLASMPWQDGAAVWTAAACLIGAAYTSATARELWRVPPEGMTSRRPALLMLLAHAGIYGLRGAGALLAVPLPGSVAALLLLEAMIHTVGMALLLMAMVKDRAELRSTNALRALARQDVLTGIGNRRHFDERLEAELHRATRRAATLALLMIDVDHFKAFNDAVGHQTGDACLRQVAQTIEATVRRPGDIAARYGGEEFAVVLAQTSPAGALGVAEAIRAAVERLQIRHPGTGGVITISIGVAESTPGTGSDALLRRADSALYRAKAAGRNRVQRAEPAGVAALQ